jgi:LysM repeat protein
MRILACFTAILLGPLSLFAEGRTEVELLRARASEQERQISVLETEVEQLREQIAFERRRARTTVLNAEGKTPALSPAAETRKPTPTPTSTPPQGAPKGAVKYTVKVGDTLSAIARRYNTSAKALMVANGIKDPTRLGIGQVLKIPGKKPAVAATPEKKPAAPAPKPESKPTPGPSSMVDSYNVKPGDTLSKVARHHGMTISQITQANPGLNPNLLSVGQQIHVSNKPMVKKSPAAPIQKHTVATNKPLPAPALTPMKPAPAPKPEPKPLSTITVSNEISYDAFANKYGTTAERLNALNGLKLKGSTVLAKGSALYVATN